jgi:TolB protein
MKKLAFVRNFGSYYGWDICTINPDGTDMQRITKDSSNNLHPSWSPDGTKITFDSMRGSHIMSSIYVMDADGGNISCLTEQTQFCRQPAWSPDSRHIAYCTMVDVSPGGAYSPRMFVPDDIFVMDTDGKNKQYVVGGWCPSWTSDSQYIAYTSGCSGSAWLVYTINIENLDIAEYNASGFSIKFPQRDFPTAVISPDGKSVAFDHYGKPYYRRDVYIMSLDTKEVRRLTGKMEGSCSCPTWSPDGTKVAFVTIVGTKANANIILGGQQEETAIYVIDADGNNPTLLVEDGMQPSWQR